MTTPTQVPTPVFIIGAIILAAVCFVLAGCATSKPKRDLEFGDYLGYEPKQIIDPIHGPNFGPHPVHGTADPSTYLPETR